MEQLVAAEGHPFWALACYRRPHSRYQRPRSRSRERVPAHGGRHLRVNRRSETPEARGPVAARDRPDLQRHCETIIVRCPGEQIVQVMRRLTEEHDYASIKARPVDGFARVDGQRVELHLLYRNA